MLLVVGGIFSRTKMDNSSLMDCSYTKTYTLTHTHIYIYILLMCDTTHINHIIHPVHCVLPHNVYVSEWGIMKNLSKFFSVKKYINVRMNDTNNHVRKRRPTAIMATIVIFYSWQLWWFCDVVYSIALIYVQNVWYDFFKRVKRLMGEGNGKGEQTWN